MSNTRNHPLRLVLVLCLVVAGCTSIAVGQLPAAGTAWQFDVTGFIQQATLGGIGCGAAPTTGALACGTIMVNGHTITVPSNTVVMLPANQLTWGELFSQAPAPYTNLATGMAMADVPAPLTTYEAHVVGNVLPGPTPGVGTYIAGLVNISQQGLNSGAGYITAINYVPGPLATTQAEIQILTADGFTAKVRLNDPSGRFGQAQTTDARFGVDPDNPTIASGTGFPMCLPRSAAGDALCPQTQRPLLVGGGFAGSFFMNVPGSLPDPTIQAPMEVGDYVTFAGNLVLDCVVTACNGGPTAMPLTGFPATLGVPTAGATYISAHTIVSNVAIFTQPRLDPAYTTIEVSLIGTGGLTVLGATEAVVRTRFEGFSTDPSRQVHIYGIDVPQPPGTDRDYGTIGVDPGPPTGAVKGRWRFRPPCLVFGSVPTKFDKQCVMNLAGTFLPVTREVRAVVETPACPAGSTDPILGTACPAIGAPAIPAAPLVVANGITSGQYHAPVQEYIFVENIPGTPVPPADFNGVPFLANGGYASTLGTVPTGALNPWPGTVAPVTTCTAPTASTGGPYQVASGGTVTLGGTAGGTSPTVLWTVSAGTLSSPTILNPVFTAPAVTATTTVTITLTVTACGASVSSSGNITVNAPTAPTVSYLPVSPITAISGTPVTITATGVDPGGLKVDVSWTQTGGTPIVVSPNPLVCKGTTSTTTCVLNFTVLLPLGAPSTTLTLSAQATNSAGVSSAPDATTVTIMPAASVVSVTSAEYRTGKQRLIINATDNIISPSIVLTLAPYLTTTGTTYDPCAGTGCVFTNNGGGLYILDTVGAPAPACNNPNGTYATPCTAAVIVVKSSDGGQSLPSVLTRIRQ